MAELMALTGGWGRPAEAGAGEIDERVERAVREHAGLVYRVAYAVLRSHADAEDATQEVFLRVLRLRRDLEGVRSPRTWLARIAFRVAVDRRPRGRHVSLDDASIAPDVASLRSEGLGADEIASSRELQALLASRIEALPDDLRHTLQLSTVEELTSSEIALLTGVPEGTVRTRLMRARRLLRDALSGALGSRP